MNQEYWKSHADKLVVCLLEIIIGVLLFLNPTRFLSRAISLVGIVLLIYGVFQMLNYFRMTPAISVGSQRFARGVVAAVLGLFFTLRSGWIVAIFPMMTTMFGVVMLIVGIVKLQWALDLMRMGVSRWQMSGLSALLMVILSVVVLAKPFGAMTLVWRFIAATLVIEAGLDVLALVLSRKPEEEVIWDK